MYGPYVMYSVYSRATKAGRPVRLVVYRGTWSTNTRKPVEALSKIDLQTYQAQGRHGIHKPPQQHGLRSNSVVYPDRGGSRSETPRRELLFYTLCAGHLGKDGSWNFARPSGLGDRIPALKFAQGSGPRNTASGWPRRLRGAVDT